MTSRLEEYDEGGLIEVILKFAWKNTSLSILTLEVMTTRSRYAPEPD
ncbi:MAG: hypothetical protein HC920_15780 [Oscillatoriales cyanobacterium SM2_3_0]|nr:hypothetical protein [Oscillatoriales cyanobacterium SM2_3_0]